MKDYYVMALVPRVLLTLCLLASASCGKQHSGGAAPNHSSISELELEVFRQHHKAFKKRDSDLINRIFDIEKTALEIQFLGIKEHGGTVYASVKFANNGSTVMYFPDSTAHISGNDLYMLPEILTPDYIRALKPSSARIMEVPVQFSAGDGEPNLSDISIRRLKYIKSKVADWSKPEVSVINEVIISVPVGSEEEDK